ncbi:hypothetical protein PVAND_013200 [Polypedilum vanderplanki]|uniref:Uncharacterized protein n=1 Tax=Polypedilum vanderplanki TaxID=319348 RepID=A0A9J6CPQ7_POLVA|nr:hypothetical protein PVAND_013200 [Polypedilum vanderplanki]
MLFTFLFIILLQCCKISDQIILECEFKSILDFYTCTAKNFQTTFNDRNVTCINGTHQRGYTNDDVIQVDIEYQNCPFLPLNLNNVFPNLKNLMISKSNVQHLLSGDLHGLQHLQYLVLSNNPIDQIGHDFFLRMSNLISIVIENCHLKKIDPETFDFLPNLQLVSLSANECIDNYFVRQNINGFPRNKLKASIVSQCQRNEENLKPKTLKNCKRKAQTADSLILDYFAIIIIAFLLIVTIVLIFFFLWTYKKKFHGNWSQMKRYLK